MDWNEITILKKKLDDARLKIGLEFRKVAKTCELRDVIEPNSYNQSTCFIVRCNHKDHCEFGVQYPACNLDDCPELAERVQKNNS